MIYPLRNRSQDLDFGTVRDSAERRLGSMRKNEQPLQPTGNVPVVCADPNLGLHSGQVRERERAGYMNTPINPPTKSVGQIILSNVLDRKSVV